MGVRKAIPVNAYNLETKELLKFPSKNKLALFFMELYNIEISTTSITKLIEKQKKPYLGVWVVNYDKDLE